MSRATSDALTREQKAFDSQLEALLKEHVGAFALFSGGEALAYFGTYEQALEDGIRRFGIDRPFLIARVQKSQPRATSLSWELGVMFG